MTDNFYRAFEERHRGSRELIKSRLKAYQPFLDPLLGLLPKPKALDLGCGRGEWLEYLAELGFSGRGVDLDEGMLAACVDLGLSVEKSDLIDYLKHVDTDSIGLVSAFHVVEHISFDDLRVLVAEAMRSLMPGGLLIMETPNPENIVVATRNFYLDPTHQKPIPSDLLGFVAEFSGFQRVKTIRLQEAKGLIDKNDINMSELLGGVSPDYAIIAQKPAETEVMALFDGAFEQDYGLSLETLTARFDRRLTDVEGKASEAETRAVQSEARVAEAETKASEAAAGAAEAEANISALVNSRSWRITAPMRALSRGVKGVHQLTARSQVKLLLQHASLYIQRRPRLKRLLLRIIDRFPKLKNRLVAIARQRTVTGNGNHQQVPVELENLTPHARRIHQELKLAVKKRREYE